MTITLTWEEVLMAATVGLRREIKALARNHKDRFDWKRDGWRQHIGGACAELAVSRALDLSWTGVPFQTWSGPDVGRDVQVRYRPNPDQPDLSLRAVDELDDRFVLVHGAIPTFQLMGWCYGREHPSDRDLWFVSVAELHPMEEWS